ncbi:MAG TPA: hypothetical protein VMH87_14215 [Pseudomonadales bacterium]|nr:hypothetical protein [Pseudomonadales bacterium]
MKHLFLTSCIVASFAFCGREVFADNTGLPTANVYVSSKTLPASLKRVLVLPLACENSDVNFNDLSQGCRTLNPVVQSELTKVGRFEVIAITPQQLRTCTGQLSWNGTETLPPDFFSNLRNVYGCDGVLFCDLTTFRPNDPLAVGWRFKLTDAATGKIIWSADEIFDAGNLDVAKDAERFEKSRQPHHNFMYNTYSFLAWCVDTPTRSALDDQWKILHSPSFFAEYSLANLLATLPPR